MKKLNQLLALILILVCTQTFAQNQPNDILGQWTNRDSSRIIEFVKSGSGFDAIIRKSEDPSQTGKNQISSLKYSSAGIYSKGTLHIYKKGKETSVTVKMIDDKKIEIIASIGFGSKSETWTRLK